MSLMLGSINFYPLTATTCGVSTPIAWELGLDGGRTALLPSSYMLTAKPLMVTRRFCLPGSRRKRCLTHICWKRLSMSCFTNSTIDLHGYASRLQVSYLYSCSWSRVSPVAVDQYCSPINTSSSNSYGDRKSDHRCAHFFRPANRQRACVNCRDGAGATRDFVRQPHRILSCG